MKKYLYVITIIILSIPSLASAIGPCEAEITNDDATDPGVIFGQCWDPTDEDCDCNSISSTGCLTNYASKQHSSEEFDKTCSMKNYFHNDYLLKNKDHSKVKKLNGNYVQMLFFAPNLSYLNLQNLENSELLKAKDIQEQGKLKDINEDLIKQGYQAMTPADLARDEFVQDALDSWKMSKFHIPNNGTIKTTEENRILYIMGYPFFINGYCIWHNCDDNAYASHPKDWFHYMTEYFNQKRKPETMSTSWTPLSINNFQMLEKKKPFIALGRNWTHFEENNPKDNPFTDNSIGERLRLLSKECDGKHCYDTLKPVDYTNIKKRILLDGTLNLEGDGYIIFKNIHFILGKKGNFKINGKTTVVFSECIIEYQDNGNTKSTFVLNDIIEKESEEIVVLDTLPENPAPLYLYFTDIKIPLIENASSENMELNPIRTFSIEVSGGMDLSASDSHFTLIGNDPNNMPNPWNLTSSGPKAELSNNTFSKTIVCVKGTIDTCMIDKTNLGNAHFYHQREDKKLMFQAYPENLVTQSQHNYTLKYNNSEKHIAYNSKTKEFYKIEIRTPTINELLGREGKPWEIVTQKGNQYILGCSYNHLKVNNEGNGCTCVSDALEFNDYSGNCMPQKKNLIDGDGLIIEDVLDSDGKLINRKVSACSEIGEIPNEDKDKCIECDVFHVESISESKDDNGEIITRQLSKCEPLSCAPGVLYKEHSCGEKCLVPNTIPNPDEIFPTECIPCENYQKAGEGELAGTCIDLNCNEDEIMVPYNHECVKCKTNFIAEGMECVACPAGTNRLGNDNICADADEGSTETQDCESDEDCGDVQVCSADGECENIICNEDEIIDNHSCVGESNPIECQEDIECNDGYACISNNCIRTCETNKDCDTQLVCGADGQCKSLVCETPLVAAEHQCKDTSEALYVSNASAVQPGGCSLISKSSNSSNIIISFLFLISLLISVRMKKLE